MSIFYSQTNLFINRNILIKTIRMRFWALVAIIVVSLASASGALVFDGECSITDPCPNGLCCSKYGYCGDTDAYCGKDCISGCPTPSPPPPPPPPPTPPPPPSPSGGDDVSSVISEAMFLEMFPNINYYSCEGRNGFYTYSNFLAAAKLFPSFGTTGNTTTRQREVAAFFGQTSQETTGGWDGAPGGKYSWGYCFVEEQNDKSDHCIANEKWPCASGKKYYGRGPIQLSYNANYGQAGDALNVDLLNNPDLVAQDPILSFKTALWFWMTPQDPKPSCHDVITDQWTPSERDIIAGRLPGYGVITNIINGGVECGQGSIGEREKGRIAFYERYLDMYQLDYGDNLDCSNQKNFESGLFNPKKHASTKALHDAI